MCAQLTRAEQSPSKKTGIGARLNSFVILRIKVRIGQVQTLQYIHKKKINQFGVYISEIN